MVGWFAVVVAVKTRRHRIVPGAFLFGSFESFIAPDLVRIAGRDKGVIDGARLSLIAHLQRTTVAMQAIRTTLIAFGFLEIGKHALPVPTFTTKLHPFVIVSFLPAHLEHGVDCGTSAQGLAARLTPSPFVPLLLGSRF